jgi:hypothetical protein
MTARGKSTFALCLSAYHSMNTYPALNWTLRREDAWGSGGIALRILNVGTRWGWEVNFTPQPLYTQGNSPQVPLERRLSGPRSRSGRGGEEREESLPLPGIEPRSPNPWLGHITDWTTSVPSYTKDIMNYCNRGECNKVNKETMTFKLGVMINWTWDF